MKHKKLLIWLISVALALALIMSGLAIYVSDYYRADSKAVEAFSSTLSVKKTDLGNALAFGNGNENTAFIFYQGGKVDYAAYQPLMEKIASSGIFCVVVDMPFRLAVLNINAAEAIRDKYPDIEHWYIGGHSLGGSMAASHLGSTEDKYEGLILLGAYSTEKLSDRELRVLSIYGSEDGVMNREKYEKYKPNLPNGFEEKVIDGACHAYFGMYGEQDGDGTPTVTPEEQINISAGYIYEFIIKE